MIINRYSLDGNMESNFMSATLCDLNKINIKESNYAYLALKEAKEWSRFLGIEEISKGIIATGQEHKGDLATRGIAYEFSKLKTEQDISTFANKYGLLGIKLPETKKRWANFLSGKKTFGNTIFLILDLDYPIFEPLDLWYFFIDYVRKLLKLYRALVNVHKGEINQNDIEGNILNIGKKLNEKKYLIEWWDGVQTGNALESEIVEKGDFLEIARIILLTEVNRGANKKVNNLVTNVIETGKPPLGFIIQQSKYTEQLINVIYQDMWELISRNEPVYICANPNCKLPFKKVKRQQYCSNACKQEAYRIRKSHSPN
ncbi:hypothetical protein NST63_27635 [Heyndrickxia sp. FSL W8-0496]|uniref:hypothetical protein n=1 Tax=Heyndrickxia sp. FSL W8-0496 TaxID=2954702 RepID=UPI0030F6B090